MPNALYEDPRIYDVLHTPGTAEELRSLLRLARAHAPAALPQHGRTPAPVWLEPACGSARLLRALAARGAHAVGFDLSPDMIAYAAPRVARAAQRAGAPAPTLFTADMRDFRLPRAAPRAHAAFNLINSIRHLRTDADMVRHLRAVARALAPDAVYLVGLSLTAYALEAPSEDVWHARAGRLHVRQVVQYLPPDPAAPPRRRRDETVHSVVVVSDDRDERESHARYTLRCFDLTQWERAVARAGLRIHAVCDQDARPVTPAPPGYFLFVLRHA